MTATVDERLQVVEDILLTIARDVECTCEGVFGQIWHQRECARSEAMEKSRDVVVRVLGYMGERKYLGKPLTAGPPERRPHPTSYDALQLGQQLMAGQVSTRVVPGGMVYRANQDTVVYGIQLEAGKDLFVPHDEEPPL
jgi:hypothetical protein